MIPNEISIRAQTLRESEAARRALASFDVTEGNGRLIVSRGSRGLDEIVRDLVDALCEAAEAGELETVHVEIGGRDYAIRGPRG